ncbi:MAG: NAD(P)/FAD-dependent oxidoreductase [Blastocatellia bacterium]|jgi:flavin-dependent dehydrogenase
MNSRYDVIVIGAGPAGSAAAIVLATAGRRVLLLEKSRFPREKLCGEFLTPECLPILARLGVLDRMCEAGAAPIHQFTLFAPDGQGIPIPLAWIGEGRPFALGLSRACMDWILLERAREVGVEVRQEMTVHPSLTEDGPLLWIEGQSPGQVRQTFGATMIVDASGRNGVFHKQTEQSVSRFEGARIFGCKVHLRRLPGLEDQGELFFFHDGYGGLSDVEGERTNLCFLTTERTLLAAKGDRERLLDLTLRTNLAARRRLSGAEVVGEWLGTGPITYGRQPSPPGVLTIGDAGAFIDPFTGSGMLLAFSSGLLAGDVIDEHFQRGTSDRATILDGYRAKHLLLFHRRYRAVSFLRQLAFRPAVRHLLVGILKRRPSLARMVARSTRLHSPPRHAA